MCQLAIMSLSKLKSHVGFLKGPFLNLFYTISTCCSLLRLWNITTLPAIPLHMTNNFIFKYHLKITAPYFHGWFIKSVTGCARVFSILMQTRQKWLFLALEVKGQRSVLTLTLSFKATNQARNLGLIDSDLNFTNHVKHKTTNSDFTQWLSFFPQFLSALCRDSVTLTWLLLCSSD